MPHGHNAAGPSGDSARGLLANSKLKGQGRLCSFERFVRDAKSNRASRPLCQRDSPRRVAVKRCTTCECVLVL
eukprot:3339783-Pyramimonas_sp.AAC.1